MKAIKKPTVIANWKMNFSKQEVVTFCESLMRLGKDIRDTMLIASPSIYLGLLSSSFPGLHFAGQDVSLQQNYGPFTGETSSSMLKSCGVDHAIIGHSERRANNFENNITTKQKVENCFMAGITPIICFGETLEIRQQGLHLEYLQSQLLESVPSTAKDHSFILAYEPVWAIGSGITPSTEQLNEVYNCIMPVASSASLVYGGSINSNNVSMLHEVDHLDGLLIGGASLKSAEFIQIAEYWVTKC
ncbi:MAG: triose-phosphate isomerase family protein [Pseudomonadota bacterium]